MTTVRSSVPLRTVLFVLPPLLLPVLAFDLSIVGVVVVWLLLLWVVVGAGVMAALVSDGTDQIALRVIERRLTELAGRGRQPGETPTDRFEEQALAAIGAQLDALSDRLDQLVARQSSRASSPPRPGAQDGWTRR